MLEIVKSLQSIIFGENNNEIDSVIQPETKKGLPNSTSADIACMYSKNSELYISNLIKDYNLESIDNECKHILNQAKKLFVEIFDTEDSLNIFIGKLIGLLIKTQDEGNNFNETGYFIIQCINLSNLTSNDIFKWLEENQMESK